MGSKKLFVVLSAGLAVISLLVGSARSQESYSAMAIASEGEPGASGRIAVRISFYTTDAEREQLLAAFKKSPASDGMVLLRSMSKGYVNVEGQAGRRVHAAFKRHNADGTTRIVLIAEHVLSKLEQRRGAKVEDYPLAVLHLDFDARGNPVSGEIFPAAKISVVAGDFIDVQTDASNKVTLTSIARR
jgi:hypothetical protein